MLPRLGEIVRESNFNCFEIVSRVEAIIGSDKSDAIIAQLHASSNQLPFNEKERRILLISIEAFLADKESNSQKDRHAKALNGYIVTDSESDDDPSKIAEAKKTWMPHWWQ